MRRHSGSSSSGVRCSVEQPRIAAPLGPVNKASIVMNDHLYSYLLQHTREHPVRFPPAVRF